MTDTIDLPSPTPAPLKQAAATKILCGAVRTISATYCCQGSCLGAAANPITITNDQWATETFEITVDPYGPDQLVVAGPSVPLTPPGWPNWLPGPSFDLWIVSPDPAFWTTGAKLCGIAKAKHPPAFTPDARSPEQEMFPNSFECDSGNIPPTVVPDPPLVVE